MRLLGLIAVLLVLAAAAAAVYAWLGYYNVAASEPHAGFVRASLQTIRDNSIERHARAYPGAGPPLDEPEMIRTGASHYAREGCAGCHGGPGAPQGEIAKHMLPQPPDLTRTAARWTDAELFWIMQNGIKLTGMPAFGPTHDEDELWAMVAFVRKLPTMTPEEYEQLTGEADRPRHAENEDAHDHGGPGEENPEQSSDYGDGGDQ